MLRIEINLGNDAFFGLNFEIEVARLLNVVRQKVSSGCVYSPLFDINGNDVGFMEVIND